MITTVTRDNRVAIPAGIGRSLGIKPGWKLAWELVGDDELRVRVIPDRAEMARRLLGSGKHYAQTAMAWLSYSRNAKPMDEVAGSTLVRPTPGAAG